MGVGRACPGTRKLSSPRTEPSAYDRVVMLTLILGDDILAQRIHFMLKKAVTMSRPLGAVRCVMVKSDLADPTDPQAITEFITRANPAVVINCVATADAADMGSSRDAMSEGLEVNSSAAGVIALASRGVGAFFIHMSTELVFGGGGVTGPYSSSDRPAPLSSYGLSRYWGELVVHSVSQKGRYLIVRVPQMFGQGIEGPAERAREAWKIHRAEKEVGLMPMRNLPSTLGDTDLNSTNTEADGGLTFRFMPTIPSNCLTTPGYVDHVASRIAYHVLALDFMTAPSSARMTHIAHCSPDERPISWFELLKPAYDFIYPGSASPRPTLPGLGGLRPSIGWELPPYEDAVAAFMDEGS